MGVGCGGGSRRWRVVRDLDGDAVGGDATIPGTSPETIAAASPSAVKVRTWRTVA